MEHLMEFIKHERVKSYFRIQSKFASKRVKTKSDIVKEAQSAFNSCIRARDRGKSCISCGKILLDGALGGGYDCGHYRSIGSAPHLRFYYWNAHGQCKKCNRYLSGNVVEYRKGLVQRIGIEKLKCLETNQILKSYTIDDLQRIKRIAKKWQKRFI